jgi:geranylgeranyl pyrophosphate synthase
MSWVHFWDRVIANIMGGQLLDLMNTQNFNIKGTGEDLLMKKCNFVCIFEFTQNRLQTSYSL